MTTLIDWDETRRCEPCGNRNERMVLMSVSNHQNQMKYDEWHQAWLKDAHAIMRPTGEKVIKIFGCMNCGIKLAEGGVLP